MSFTPVATTDTLETFRTRYNATNITLVDDSSTTVDITLATDSLKLSGGTGIASAISGDTVTFNLSNTGVSAASYGSSTAIPVLAVNAQGQITSASTASISTDLTVIDDASTSATISLATDSFKISGGTGTTSAISGDTLTINLDNTSVSAGSYGSGSAIPVITIDAQGRITAASTAAASSDLTIADSSSTTEVFTLGSETLKFAGGTGVTAALSSGTVTYSFDGTSFTTFKYTATSGQTTFSGADANGNTLAYSSGKRNVYLNGVLLDESDITASNGTSVVLASAAAANDILTVIAFAVNNIAVLDANGSEFVLDADGDTSITADTDDQIDFKLGGSDRMVLTPAKIQLKSSGNAELELQGGTSSADNSLKYLNSSGSRRGFISYDTDNDFMFIGTSNAEKVRIDSSGNVGIGTTSPQSALHVIDAGATPCVFDMTGTTGDIVLLRNDGSTKGSISTDGTNVAYNTSSDYRLKENVDYSWDATTRLKQLKPCRFNWIADDTNTLLDGFIAHEVSSIVPEAVNGTKDAMETYTDDDGEEQTREKYQGIDQSKLVPLLVKTIQELEVRITTLEG